MSNTISNNQQSGAMKREWRKKLKKGTIPLLTLSLVIAITVALFVLSQRYPEKAKELENYGYLGVFLISLISNATVILPVPGILIFIPLMATFNPILLGLAGAAGGVIGEITGYMAGYSGRGMIQNRQMYHRVEGWMKRWGSWIVFVFAVAPFFPVDIAGMVAGALRYPLWKFLLMVWVGKSLKYIALALAGAWGWEAVLRYFG